MGITKTKNSKLCKVCNKEFFDKPSKLKKRKFCSIECFSKYKADNGTIKKECPTCNSLFTVISSKATNRKYCSTSCYHKSKELKQERICKNCKKTYLVVPSSKSIDHCSKECREHSEAKKRITKECSICNKEFETSSKRVTCSSQCASILKQNKFIVKKCLRCNKEYVTYKNNPLKYCSRECSLEIAYTERECIHCKTKFRCRIKSDTKFCSKECVGLYNRIDKEFINKQVTEDGFELLSIEYLDIGGPKQDNYITIKCKEGHIHNTRWKYYQKGNRCPQCNPHYSKAEKELLNEIEKFYNKELIPNDRVQIKPYELDIYIPEHKLAIEFCGLYWHSYDMIGKRYHRKKLDSCIEKGIRLITIFEDEWINQKEIVISKIKQALNLTENRIYARKTEVKEISPKEANLFYEETHLQGKTRGSINYALTYNNNIVACITIGSPSRAHTAKNTLEIKRYATKLDTSVVGGFSRLLKKVNEYAKERGHEKIRSHNDLRYGKYDNNVYEKLNFYKVGETKYTPHYTKNGKRYRNFSLRKTPEERLTGKTEVQLRKEQGYSRIFDCGHQTYDFSIEL